MTTAIIRCRSCGDAVSGGTGRGTLRRDVYHNDGHVEFGVEHVYCSRCLFAALQRPSVEKITDTDANPLLVADIFDEVVP